HHGSEAKVRDDEGEESRVQMRQSARDLVVGDRVFLQQNDGDQSWIIVARGERKTEIFRTDQRGSKKLIAANLDALLVVVAPQPEPHLNLVDRYLAAAEIFDISPAIVINKSDLVNASVLDEIQRIYPKLGYPVFRVSAFSKESLDVLNQWVQGKKLAFVGQSGVGKSSLINSILEKFVAQVGALSGKRPKGRHTTTASHTYPMPENGWIMDSPGIREFGNSVWTFYEIVRGFPEIQKFSEQCKFRNCVHGEDRGCAVRQALTDGKIEASRFQTFISLVTDEAGQRKP
ncbi:MAG: ribosome small subunit-dependent GTPase A, partial [Pseudomonadales bacterium]